MAAAGAFPATAAAAVALGRRPLGTDLGLAAHRTFGSQGHSPPSHGSGHGDRSVHKGSLQLGRGSSKRRIGFEVTIRAESCSWCPWSPQKHPELEPSMQHRPCGMPLELVGRGRGTSLGGGWPFAGIADIASVMPVTRYDARGHGISDPACSEGYTWHAMGGDVVELQKAWRKRHVFLGGTSMGAAASLYAVLQEPSAFQGLILATPPTCYETRRKFVPFYLESIEMARKEGLEEAKRVASKKTRPPIFMETEGGRNQFEAGWKTKSAMGLERYCAALEGAALSDLPGPDQLKTIEVPTLILAWRSDVQHPLETAEMLKATLPNAELVVASTWSEIQQFPRHMREFLSRQT
mmetsp:Transcript_26308/g.87189  ORF Transcript_26308/g.87189 Transcript_26308/m.87189 type:complete len:351 (-) Transcript_26308:2-1054(-)